MWGASTLRGMASPRRGFTLHHNGPPANCVGHPHSRCVAFWESVVRFHTVDKGWSGVAYSFGVCHHGERFVGRGWDRYQFANGSDTVGADDGDDSEWYTILWFVGGDDSTGDAEPPTAAMIVATDELIREGRDTGRCGTAVLPHNRFKRKPCPGPDGEAYCATRHGRPLPPTLEDPFDMFDDIAHFRRELAAVVDARLDARLGDDGKGGAARQGVFDLARAASILGGFLAWPEDAEQGDPVYWVTPTGKLEFPQGSPLHNWFKSELVGRGQKPDARRMPVPVLEQLPTTSAYPPASPAPSE